jgi:hypothetical protein
MPVQQQSPAALSLALPLAFQAAQVNRLPFYVG